MTNPLCTLIARTCCALLMVGGCGYDVVPSGGVDAGAHGGKDAGGHGPRLPDRVAGKACRTNAECANGTCAKTLSATLEPNAPPAPGGYCTAPCAADVDCGAAGKCAVPAGAGTGQCLATCKVLADCREGYLCVAAGRVGGLSVSGTCQPAPMTDVLGDGIAGTACARDADCSGGRCASTSALGTPFPGNYCTGSCFVDAECGAGGSCVLLSGSSSAGQCFAGCASDVDCTRDGYRCRELNDGFSACYPALAKLPDGTAGKACGSDSECGAEGTCAAELPFGSSSAYENVPAPDGYCTEACSLDADCGEGGACISHGMHGGACLATCTIMTGCRAGYQCAQRNDRVDLDRICIPQ